MAAEAISEECPRIKFTARRTGAFSLAPAAVPQPLLHLSALMHRLEACGVIPVLCDGLVGGNCGIAAAACGLQQHGSAAVATSVPPFGATLLVSRSGKQPGTALQAEDWVLLQGFDAAQWQADYMSADDAARPTSDAPLHVAALGPGAQQRYRFDADMAGLEHARERGLPISEHETLFSTPQDLEALEDLFRAYPYPHHRCFIRRGHGFMLLASSVADAEQQFERHVMPLLSQMQQNAACESQP